MRKNKLLTILCILTLVLALGATAYAEKVKWRMGSTWTPAINLYHGDKSMIQYLKDMTNGDFEVTWFPSGSLMKAFEYFDACSKGVVEAVGDWPSYWVSKDPAFDFLGSMPYGFTNMDYVTWYYQFGGEALYNEALRQVRHALLQPGGHHLRIRLPDHRQDRPHQDPGRLQGQEAANAGPGAPSPSCRSWGRHR